MKAPIGIFDSGYGGLSVFKKIAAMMPWYDYLYFGDNAHAPYGERNHHDVYELTKKAVSFLFMQGAPLVILACNTASALALRKLQQEWLLEYFPERRILGVLIPVVEDVAKTVRAGDHIGLVATPATIASGAYQRELEKYLPRGCSIIEQACPLLVPLIEGGYGNHEVTREALKEYLSPFRKNLMQSLILGCTHYPLLLSHFQFLMSKNTPLFYSGENVALALKSYLIRHPEIERRLSREGAKEYYTTGDPVEFRTQAEKLFI